MGIALLALCLIQTYAFTGSRAEYGIFALESPSLLTENSVMTSGKAASNTQNGKKKQAQNKRRKANPDERVDFSADKLYHDITIVSDGRILVGHVHLNHDGMTLTCDSAVMYEGSNSFLAYGKVHMTDHDSISLTGDSLYYHGTKEFAQVFSHAGKEVVFKHGKMTLYTEILNYDRIGQVGYYDTGGKLVEGKTVLTSQNGEYHTDTKTALFTQDVVMINNGKDKIVTNKLDYDTKSKWAVLTGESNIYSDASIIYTTDGHYNTESGKALLYDRPQLSNKNRNLIGDSIHYDKNTKRTYAYNNIIFTDADNNSILLGDYGWYDEEKGEAMCTKNAVAQNFSNGKDTLFIHGDTLRLFTFNNKTDSAYRVLTGYYHVRAFREDMQMVCDSLRFVSKDSCITLYKDPIAWNESRQILGEEIQLFLNDSTIDSVYINRQAIMIEQQSDSTLYNQVAGNQMRSYMRDGEMKEYWVDGNGQIVNYPMEKDSTYLYLNYVEAAKFRAFMEEKKLRKVIGLPSPKGTTYPLTLAPEDRTKLPGFAWFDWIRPKDKNDIFIWRSKGEKNKLKDMPRRNAPMQTLQRLSKSVAKEAEEHSKEIEENTKTELDKAGLEVKVE